MTAELFSIDADPQVLLPAEFATGQIVDEQMHDPSRYGLTDRLNPGRIVQCEIDDPHTNHLELVRPGTVEAVQRQERVMNAFARVRLKVGGWRRNDIPSIAYEQPAGIASGEIDLDNHESIANGDTEARRKYFAPESILGDDALIAWQTTIPSAMSLIPLSSPTHMTHIADRVGNVYEATDKTRDWLTACTDGQEIRNRGAVMVDRVSDFLDAYVSRRTEVSPLVVSVAGGTALPTMQAIVKSGVPNARLLLLESDEQSAQLSLELAEKVGFTGEIIIRKTDVFSPSDMKAVRQELEAIGQKAAVADAVGIVEYTSAKLYTEARARRFGEDYYLYNPEQFIKAVVDLVEDDGMTIIGQMRADRPNPYFTRGVVCWPTICMRSVKRFAEVLDGAGVDLNATEFSMTPLGVYTMASIYKDAKISGRANGASFADNTALHGSRKALDQRGGVGIPSSILTGEVVR